MKSTHKRRYDLEMRFYRVLRHAEIDSGSFRAVYGLWKNFVKNDPKIDPKMVKIEAAVEGSHLIVSKSDKTVLKIPKNDDWDFGPVQMCLTVTEISDHLGLM